VGCPAFPTYMEEAPVFSERTSVGLDVHARSVVGHGIDQVTGEVFTSRLVPDGGAVMEWLAGLPGPTAVLYEAGPTGFGLARQLRSAGYRCEVAAPSKLRRPSGDRVKTDARDAEHLSRLLRLDDFTAVAVPQEATEAARDLVRCREDCRSDLMRARHRVSKMLLRHGVVWSGGHAWTGDHLAWLARQRFSQSVSQYAFEEALDQVLATVARRDRLDSRIEELAADSAWTPVVRRLGCLRGISTLTGFALAVEIGDWARFDGNSIGAYVGLVPSENSSGKSRVLGPITKTGNGHIRRLLVEAAWHHRPRYVVGKTLRGRWALATPAARARGDAGNRRLHSRWVVFQARKKRYNVATIAVARELAGWCWSLAMIED